MKAGRRVLSCLVAPALAAACASSPSAGPELPAERPDAAERSLLLLLADRELYEPLVFQRALVGSPELRREVAVTLGRIADPRGRRILEGLARDEAAAVRRTALFALGVAKEAEAAPLLLEVAAGASREEALLAVEALGKAGVPLGDVLEALTPLGEAERWARLLPSLYRFDSPSLVPLAQKGLERPEGDLHRWAAYALARNPKAEGLPVLRALALDPEPRIRAWAARALGLVGTPEDLPLLVRVWADGDGAPVVYALRSAKRLSAGRAEARLYYAAALLPLLADRRPGVALTALEVAGGFLPHEALAAALVERLAAGKVLRERELALLALAEGGAAEAGELARQAALAPEATLRARAAEAAGKLRDREILARLAADPAPLVRSAVLSARVAAWADEAVRWLTEALADPDIGVRSTAFGELEGKPLLPFEAIETSLTTLPPEDVIEAQLGAISALVARAKVEALERGAIIASLEKLATAPQHLLRRAAADALVALDRPRPDVGPVEASRGGEVYRQILVQTARPRTVELRTNRGTLRVRLACPEAPLTCLSFLQLAAGGFYDGLAFHRVIPDFVVQGGDPRGDGFGGPGYSLRDEINPLRYRRGVIGMAHAGPDTAGSQFFFTLSPQPHLDGAYTAFGEVVAGLEVLDRIVQGDRIESIREVP
ncbi:MAG TPA: peptidylprolyl isomerase [Thermoanaerobaculia bacterium]|nr:peptidylprolyl isomerase [Thermoanaerobaculia bacterium]